MTDNDDTVDIADDTMLRAALRAEVPDRSDNYWALIDERIAAASIDTKAPNAGEPSPDISSEPNGNTNVVSTQPLSRLRTWPVLAAAAALVLIAGLLTVRLLPSNGERVDAGFADGDTSTALEDLPGPTQNVDHWHAAYGIWDCTANDGNGAWLPAFESTEDDVGIHSHGDGLISIHPFFEASAGRNATFSHFADSMNFTVTNDTITLEDGTTLAEGAMCNGEPAVLEMYRWQDARALEADPTLPPRIIIEDFGAERFYNDLEVWTLALTPVGAEVPLPAERLDTLAASWFQADMAPQTLSPTPVAGRLGISYPPYDAYVRVGLVAAGSDLDPVIEAVLASRPPGMPTAGEQEAGSGIRWSATASEVRLQVELITYLVRDEAPGIAPTLTCWEVIEWGGGCTRTDQAPVGPPRLDANTGGDIETVALWDAPEDAVWLSLETDDGHIVLADVVEGTSWAAWRVTRGDWAKAELLDIDQNVLWSDTN